MKTFIFSTVLAIFLIGCGDATSSGDSYIIDGNGTIPYDNNITPDSNLTITPGSNVDSIVFNDDGLYISCSDGAQCDITIGDNSGNTDDSDNSINTDNSDNSTDTSDNSDSHDDNRYDYNESQ